MIRYVFAAVLLGAAGLGAALVWPEADVSGEPVTPEAATAEAETRQDADVVATVESDLTSSAPSEAQEPAVLSAPAPEPDAAFDTRLVCLAKTIYFEARDQNETGKRAVAHVVMNRVADPEFSDDVCAVVTEGGERSACEFSFWCDGRADTALNAEEYDAAIEIAREVLAGRSDDPTDGANMYHADYVSPGWISAAEGRGRIGDHLFYHLAER